MTFTKYELMVQLKDLNRGFPRLPISRMKYHELEANIDVMKKYKEDAAKALATKSQVAWGPKGARTVKSEEVSIVDVDEGENVIIHTPAAPAPRQSKSPAVLASEAAKKLLPDFGTKAEKPKKPEMAFDSPKRGRGRPPKAKSTEEATATVEKEQEQEPEKPMKLAKKETAPVAPVVAEKRRSDPVTVHFCNCVDCPHRKH